MLQNYAFSLGQFITQLLKNEFQLLFGTDDI